MKAQVYNQDGVKDKEMQLPACFDSAVRADLIWKYLEAKKTMHPYGPSPVAGKQHSASGIIKRRRHDWKASYGKGISRVPRKIMSQRGAQFNWVGAEVSGTRGGRRSHPPRPEHRMIEKKINKNEERLALFSALSATAQEKMVKKHYERLNDKKISVPFVISKIEGIKSKLFLVAIKKMLDQAYEVALPEKSVRNGKGKLRGRKYKTSAGVLIVVGAKEKFKFAGFDIKHANAVGVHDLAAGGPGRLTIYSEQAIKELEARTK